MITTAMKQIYREALQIKNVSGAPMKRAKYMESALAKREDGVWIQVHNAIEVAFDKLFENAEGIMVKKFGRSLTLCTSTSAYCATTRKRKTTRRGSRRKLYGMSLGRRWRR
jgi:hypothetical protein